MYSEVVDLTVEPTIREFQKEVDGYVTERNWKKYHKPKDIAISISIESSELLEHFQWRSDDVGAREETKALREGIREELADIMIYCLCMANVAGIDVSQALVDKIEKNRKKYPVEEVVNAKDWKEVLKVRAERSDKTGDG